MRAIIVSAIVLLAACSSPTEPDEIIKVSGQVTVAGEPVGQVGVYLASAQQCSFFSFSGPCAAGSAVTGGDGRYTLVINMGGDGCLSGTVIFGDRWETPGGFGRTSPRYGYTGCGPHVISHDFPAAE